MLEYHKSKSVVTVQSAFRAKYAQEPPTDKTICAWCKQFTEIGCLLNAEITWSPILAAKGGTVGEKLSGNFA